MSDFTLRLLKLGPCSPTYWPSHGNRHPDTLDFFLTNLPNHFSTETVNLNDPASDHTPALLLIGAQSSVKQNRPIITPGTTNWNEFRATISSKIILNTKLKSPSDVDHAIAKLSDLIQISAKDSSTQRPPAFVPSIKPITRTKISYC